ncbi:MAG: polymer-forming cytoskeletal protein [Vicinamibacterales bacterium]|jgi:cytoskeletal protein CcmA (bactofilin family)|nr:polymer-forming cytoskeletal protein [Vicinamibacterales bacterium]HJN43851.1 polymer-forming cytoskeletal protein [Vicinamibacterales bacterium]|tara:strand:+ start:2284 stop:2775 length:492 start_codon:yes stop_codon:yes gene_type:complete
MPTTDPYPLLTAAAPAPQTSARPLLRPANVTAIGGGVTVKGQLTAAEHVIIEGSFEGEVVIPDHGLAISGAAHMRGDVCARAITVLGRVDGNLTASALIELRSTAVVTGRLASPLISMEEGAQFHGSVDPTKAEAVVAVARHRLQRSVQDLAPRLTELDATDT